MTHPPDESTMMTPARMPVALAVILALLLVGSGVVWLRDRPADSSAVVAVARQEARNFFSLDHRNVENDVDKVLALAAGDFKKEYSSRRAEIVKDIRARKLVLTATIPHGGAAVEYLATSRAQVLVAVDVRSRSKQGGQDQRFRSRLTLQQIDGEWLVTKLEQV